MTTLTRQPHPVDTALASAPVAEGHNIHAVQRAMAEAEADAPVVVDFDETLFRSNSTEHFLDHARPRLLAAVILAILAVLKPWRWGRGQGDTDATDFAGRDAWRVRTICALLPWTRRRWKRHAADVMRGLENGLLAARLRASGRRVVVASYGFGFIIKPMLAGCSAQVQQLVAGPKRGMSAWRRRGKREAVQQAIGQDALERSIVITDSQRDSDLLDHASHALLLRWADEVPTRAQSSVYLPFVYLSQVKRQGNQELLRQVLLDDFALVLLVFWAVNPLSLASLLALACGFIAFFCVYEIGYRENDRLGEAHERDPRLSVNYHLRPELGHDPGIAPWLWALCLSALAAAALHAPWLGAVEPMTIKAVAVTFGLWVGLLVATRLIFGLYNRLDEVTRVFVFPWLQVVKTFGFLLMMSTTAAGMLFMIAQVFRRWLNYAAYRAGGDEKALPSHTMRVMTYIVLVAGFVWATGDLSMLTNWHAWVLLAWLMIRGTAHLSRSVQSIRWRGRLMFAPEH